MDYDSIFKIFKKQKTQSFQTSRLLDCYGNQFYIMEVRDGINKRFHKERIIIYRRSDIAPIFDKAFFVQCSKDAKRGIYRRRRNRASLQ